VFTSKKAGEGEALAVCANGRGLGSPVARSKLQFASKRMGRDRALPVGCHVASAKREEKIAGESFAPVLLLLLNSRLSVSASSFVDRSLRPEQ